MKNNQVKLVLGVFLLGILLFSGIVSAAVGIGISPSKMKEQLVAGSEYTYEILVFNTGSDPMEISLAPQGDLVGFTRIEPDSLIIEPEPYPREYPIKNGKIFRVTFDLPTYGGKTQHFVGTLSATGSGNSGSNFGGSVGVSSQIELIVNPPKSIFSKIKPVYYLIAGAIVLVLFLVILLRKAGLRISFGEGKPKKKSPKRK